MLDLKDKLEKWGKITIKVWQETMEKKGIPTDGALGTSFREQILGQQNEVLGIAMKFRMYGRFLDMGVGRGVKAYERNQNTANRTAAKRYGANVGHSEVRMKRWYNKPKMAQIYRMREILGIDLGNGVSDALSQIATEINNTVINY